MELSWIGILQYHKPGLLWTDFDFKWSPQKIKLPKIMQLDHKKI